MKVAFFDRDGVINKDTGYLHRIDDFIFVDGCIELLKQLQQQDFAVIVVTNQSGIGRGYYSEADYQHLTAWYREQLKQHGVSLLGVYHCPHLPDDHCNCRKPKVGMFQQALAKYPAINLQESLMIGDKLSDLKAAHEIGVAHLVLYGPSAKLVEKLAAQNFAGKTKIIYALSGLLDLSW